MSTCTEETNRTPVLVWSKVDPIARRQNPNGRLIGKATVPSEPKNSNLRAAKAAKEDEFYTQLPDIERELRHYRKHFEGKVVYCNCDDPRTSNFFHYFSYNFEKLGLKRLIATCYRSRTPDLFSQNDSEHAISLEYLGDANRSQAPDPEEIGVRPLEGDGDFRSAESIELLKQADIVVTNPPFSLFREFVLQLMEFDKKFLVIGSQNAVTYKEISRLIQENRIWLGTKSGDMSFRVPDYYPPRKTRYWEDENGNKWRSLGNACWFTNLDIAKRHEDLILYRTYSPDAYPTYVNYDAIEVGRTVDIPVDFAGAMGVPITFLDKHNPDQFEIIGFSGELARPLSDVVEGQKGSGRFYLRTDDGTYRRMYDRIVIRNKRL